MGGNILAKLYRRKDVRIIMQGLDAAGKTTILYRLKLGEVVTTIPTIGFNVETVSYKNVNFTAWDVGGRDQIRPLYRHYYQDTQAIIFVIDSNDRERLGEAKEELIRTLDSPELEGAPVLIMANKQDLPNALSVHQIMEKLDLGRRTNFFVVPTCAAGPGDGVYEGLEWLSTTLAKKQSSKPENNQSANVTAVADGYMHKIWHSVKAAFVGA